MQDTEEMVRVESTSWAADQELPLYVRTFPALSLASQNEELTQLSASKVWLPSMSVGVDQVLPL
ncbi:MAG: hypothetical protein ABSC00_09740 [Acidimicrobiales bacterium]